MKHTAVILGLLLSMQANADFESDLERCLPEAHHEIMNLIVEHESRKSPYALGYTENGKLVSLYPETQASARMKLKELLNKGVTQPVLIVFKKDAKMTSNSKLTKHQKALLESLKSEQENGSYCWVEIFPEEARTARSLAKRELINLDDSGGGDHLEAQYVAQS